MKLSALHLKNFRGIEAIDIPLDKSLTVIVGSNGAGKSTLLDSIATMLSWVVARIRQPGAPGRSIQEADIYNQAHAARIELCAEGGGCWSLVKIRKGHTRKNETTDLKFVSEYAHKMQEHIASQNEHCNLPVFVYYPVNRAVLDIPLRIRKKHSFSLLEAYDEALTSGANFRYFFEWFRNREDLENEQFRAVGGSVESVCDSQLQAVRRALEAFLPQFKNLRVSRNPLSMVVDKEGRPIRIEQLSDGEKCLIALVGDLARRLAIANPTLEDPLTGEGVVLIDEIELHLHPSWQRMVVGKLTRTFPHCQFLLSTHSPQVVGEVAGSCLRILEKDASDRVVSTASTQALGLDSAEILEEIMDAPKRNQAISAGLSELFAMIDDDRFQEARDKLDALAESLGGDIPAIVQARSLLAMLEGEV